MIELRTVRISDIGRVVTGKTPPSSRPELFGEDFPFLTPTDINGAARYIAPERFLSVEGHGSQQRLLLPSRSISVVCIGATIGKVCMTSRPSFTNQQINSVVVDEREHDPFYVYHLFTTLRDELRAKAGGAATPIINKTAFSEIEVSVPALGVQRKIAGILSSYEDLIENSQQRIRILEKVARILYRDWFVRGFESNFKISKGSLGDLCDLMRDPFSEDLHSNRPLLDLSRMPQRCLAPEETGMASELTTSRILFEPGDTLFGAIRCYLHKVNAAHFSGVTNTSVLVLRPRITAYRSLLAIVASDDETIRWADTHSTGTKMPVINWGVFQTMPVPLPSQELAEKFEKLTGPMLDQIGVLARQIQTLRAARDALLPRLLSGQIGLE